MSSSDKFVQPAIPRFDGHFDHWSMLMENFLRSKEMWSLVDEGIPMMDTGAATSGEAQKKGVEDAKTKSDTPKKAIEDAKLKYLKVKNYLFQAIDREILEIILDKETSKSIWDSMKQKYQGSTKVKRALLQALKKEYELLASNER
ncbi:unnamed protein product [Rhodiola kirilowii]